MAKRTNSKTNSISPEFAHRYRDDLARAAGVTPRTIERWSREGVPAKSQERAGAAIRSQRKTTKPQTDAVIRSRNYTRAEFAQLVAMAGAFSPDLVYSPGVKPRGGGGDVLDQLRKLANQIGQAAIAESGEISASTISKWINHGIPEKSRERAEKIILAAGGNANAITPEVLETIGRAILHSEPIPSGIRINESIDDVRRRVVGKFLPESDAGGGAGFQNRGDDFFKRIADDATERGKMEIAYAQANALRALLDVAGLNNPVFSPNQTIDGEIKGFRNQGSWFTDNPMDIAQVINYIRGRAKPGEKMRPLPGFFAVRFIPTSDDGVYEIQIIEPGDSSGFGWAGIGDYIDTEFGVLNDSETADLSAQDEIGGYF